MQEETIIAEIKALKELFNEKFENNEKAQERILGQVYKTNGNVTVNSARLNKLEEWKNRITGALIMTNIIIIPILIIVISNLFK